MNLKTTILFSVLVCVLMACGSGVDKTVLAGNWKLHQFLEQGEPVEINTEEVSFEFFENGRYNFNSTLNYKESGRYYTMGQLLYTTDTTVSNPIEKPVKVILLTADSLHFKMNDKGVEQDLKLYRD